MNYEGKNNLSSLDVEEARETVESNFSLTHSILRTQPDT